MEKIEILKAILIVVGSIGGILTALTGAAFWKNRKAILRVEKRRALKKLYPDEHKNNDSRDSELAGARR